jgi:hypothetical protein
MFLSALGKGILVINSQRVAVDLLEKRSNIYSDRPHFISAGGFLTQNLSFFLTTYGDLYAVRHSDAFRRSFRTDGAASVVLLWMASPKLLYSNLTQSRIAKRSCWRLR